MLAGLVCPSSSTLGGGCCLAFSGFQVPPEGRRLRIFDLVVRVGHMPGGDPPLAKRRSGSPQKPTLGPLTANRTPQHAPSTCWGCWPAAPVRRGACVGWSCLWLGRPARHQRSLAAASQVAVNALVICRAANQAEGALHAHRPPRTPRQAGLRSCSKPDAAVLARLLHEIAALPQSTSSEDFSALPLALAECPVPM